MPAAEKSLKVRYWTVGQNEQAALHPYWINCARATAAVTLEKLSNCTSKTRLKRPQPYPSLMQPVVTPCTFPCKLYQFYKAQKFFWLCARSGAPHALTAINRAFPEHMMQCLFFWKACTAFSFFPVGLLHNEIK